MNKEEMICKNCKYHYIEEISFDYPQSCCSKRQAVIEEWFNCNDFEYSDRYIKQLQKENQQLKEYINKYKRLGFKHLNDKCNKLENQQKEFIEYLENEKDRLARECSQIYEDSLGKTRLVNEDIFNEVDKILSKYKEIIGCD